MKKKKFNRKNTFLMTRKKALRSSPAGEPRQGVKVCDLLNAETVPLRYMLRINTMRGKPIAG